MQRLAAGLAAVLPWLARGHIGSLCHTLASLGLDDHGWTPHDVITLLDHRNATRRLDSVVPTAQSDPHALLAHQLRDALTTITEPPRHRREREAAARATDHARRLTDQRTTTARIAAEKADPDTQQRIRALKQQIRDDITAARIEQRRRAVSPSDRHQ